MRRALLLVTASLAILPGLWTSALAVSIGGAAGFEVADGPGDQSTRSLLGAAVFDLGAGTDAMLAGLRFDDSSIGLGWGGTAGVGLPLSGTTRLRGWVTRLTGDAGFRAWRLKGGPEFRTAAGATVGLWYSHYQDADSLASDGAILETSVPVREGLAAKLGASIATLPRSLRSMQATAGLSWTTVPHLELSGEVGIAENGSITTMGPISPGIAGELFGGGGSETRANQVSPTALLGVRVLFP